jgi:hypothetical protein
MHRLQAVLILFSLALCLLTTTTFSQETATTATVSEGTVSQALEDDLVVGEEEPIIAHDQTDAEKEASQGSTETVEGSTATDSLNSAHTAEQAFEEKQATADESSSKPQSDEVSATEAVTDIPSSATTNTTQSKPPVQAGPFVDLLGDTLLSLEYLDETSAQYKSLNTNDALRGKSVVGLYFSADWYV